MFSLNYLDYEEKQNFKKRGNVHFLHKKSTFMLQNLANNRNFAIFAAHLAYEVQ